MYRVDITSPLGEFKVALSLIALSSDALDQISQVLDHLTIEIQLSKTQQERAKNAYEGVTDWLADDESTIHVYSPWLFPQGSLAQDTTVCPIARIDFDLDIVCRIDCPKSRSPEELYWLIWDRMQASGTYSPIMEEMPRCIRLNYAKESKFHLDIVPAIPDRERGGNFILIPDGSDERKKTIWKTSNPIDFKNWLEQRKVVDSVKMARSRIDPFNIPLPAGQKAALTKAIQLLKRWRDVRWQNEPDLATPSIVLTYLAASLYQEEESLAKSFDRILDNLVEFVGSGTYVLFSPVNDRETISEKWIKNRDCYEAFVDGIKKLRLQWDEILEIAADPASGLTPLTDKLKGLFGEQITLAVKSASRATAEARSSRNLYVEKKTGELLATAPAVATTAVRARTHTFFGD
jgi:hypothetical protein